jgi:predicted nuclease of predicted toxin-antitoxin system
VETLRAEISETDEKIAELSEKEKAPILTKDPDFEEKHRKGKSHHGILFDHRIHHRNPDTVISAIKSILSNMDKQDLKRTIIRLKKTLLISLMPR